MTVLRRCCLLGLIAVSGLLAAGCDIVWSPQPVAAAGPPALPSASPSLPATPTAPPTAGAPVTVVPATAIPPSPSGADASLRAAPTEATPLVFVFPTPVAFQPPANWRPPVIGVPLSVRAEDHFWFARPIASDSVNYPLGSYRYGSD
ncbi:MAG: hypothetical protein IT318_07830, partial [Anaerolineales bacterium]|nr:hypothetical protein [Anaerolineales bacterium]